MSRCPFNPQPFKSFTANSGLEHRLIKNLTETPLGESDQTTYSWWLDGSYTVIKSRKSMMMSYQKAYT